MRPFNIYQCPKCEHYEYRQKEGFGHAKDAEWKLVCKAGKEPEELAYDRKATDRLTNSPPPCSDFELEARRRAAK